MINEDRLKIEDSIEKIPNRFQLVLVASLRARDIHHGHNPTINIGSKAGVTALREIANGTIGKEMLRKIK